MNGTHRPEGIWIASGGEESLRARPGMNLRDALPCFLTALGIPCDDESLDSNLPTPGTPSDYTHREEDLVAKRLRDLGYLE